MPSIYANIVKFSSRIDLCHSCHYVNCLKFKAIFYNNVNFFTISTKRVGENGKNVKDVVLPPEPQDCCMSGCANCVWVKYAEEVAAKLGDGGETAKAKINEHVKDPNLRAFLMLELSDLIKKKH